MIATIVPSKSAPTAAATVSLMVIQNAASTSYSANSSERPWSIQHTPSATWGRQSDGPKSPRYWPRGTTPLNPPRVPNNTRGHAPRPPGRPAGVRLWWVRRRVDLEPRWADVRVDNLLPGSVGNHLLERSVHLVTHLGLAHLQANAVPLGRERFADELELACVLRLCREAGQDHVVGGYRVHTATNQRFDALGVGVLLEQLHRSRVFLLDLLSRGRAGNRAQRSAVHRVRSGDVSVVGANEQILTGDEVRTSEGPLLLALVGNRVCREDE